MHTIFSFSSYNDTCTGKVSSPYIIYAYGTWGCYRYSSTLSLTSTVDGGGPSKPCSGRCTTGKDFCYTFYRRVGGSLRRSGRVK